MDAKLRQKKDSILAQILSATEKATPEEAMEFYEEISADCDSHVEALKEENDLG